jgi:type II secretory pathway pseudopilin PulG
MRQRSRGTTLVELLVVISVCSVIMSASGVLLHGMYRADKETRQAIATDATVARFSLQFRRDAHASDEVSLVTDTGGKTAGVMFRATGQPSTEYRWQGTEIIRTVKESDKPVHRDSFRFGVGTSVTWQLPPSGSQLVAVQISRLPRRGVKMDSLPQRRIEAVIGLAHAGRAKP